MEQPEATQDCQQATQALEFCKEMKGSLATFLLDQEANLTEEGAAQLSGSILACESTTNKFLHLHCQSRG